MLTILKCELISENGECLEELDMIMSRPTRLPAKIDKLNWR
jgi:hypothetical protein